MVPSGVYFAEVIVSEKPDIVSFRKAIKLMMLK